MFSFHGLGLGFGSLSQMITVPILGKDLHPKDRFLSQLHTFQSGDQSQNPTPAMEISHTIHHLFSLTSRLVSLEVTVQDLPMTFLHVRVQRCLHFKTCTTFFAHVITLICMKMDEEKKWWFTRGFPMFSDSGKNNKIFPHLVRNYSFRKVCISEIPIFAPWLIFLNLINKHLLLFFLQLCSWNPPQKSLNSLHTKQIQ